MKKLFVLLFVIATQHYTYAQGVKIGGTGNPDAQAILELDGSGGKGLLLPRVTNTQMNNMNAPDGMIVFNSTNGTIYLRKSNSWHVVAANNNAGGFSLPNTSTHTADNGYVLDVTNNSVNGVNGGIKGSSSTSGYGVHGSSFTGIGGYFTSSIGPALVAGTGNVGIGTAMPSAKFHLAVNNGYQHLLENTNPLGVGVPVRTIFKTGDYFTGAIGTTGSSAVLARMSFLTGATTSGPNNLWERMSILNNGNVGINTTVPLSKLEINGKTRLTQGQDNAAVEITGDIMVSGPNAPAFTVTNNGPDETKSITINHPACNGNPNAMILVTQTYGMAVPYLVKYDIYTQKWEIVTGNYIVTDKINGGFRLCDDKCSTAPLGVVVSSTFIPGHKFNVLVIKK